MEATKTKREILWSGSTSDGCYITTINNKSAQAQLESWWKSDASKKKKAREQIRSKKPERKVANLISVHTYQDSKEKMFILYVAAVLQPQEAKRATFKLAVDRFRSGLMTAKTLISHSAVYVELYVGIFTSIGQITMRQSHFTSHIEELSKIQIRLKADMDAICLEMVAIPCKSYWVVEQGEAFLMNFGKRENELLVEREEKPMHILTKVAAFDPEGVTGPRSVEYAENGVSLFEIVPDHQPTYPPIYPHLSCLAEVSTLPYKIHEADIKERWLTGAVQNNWGQMIQLITED